VDYSVDALLWWCDICDKESETDKEIGGMARCSLFGVCLVLTV